MFTCKSLNFFVGRNHHNFSLPSEPLKEAVGRPFAIFITEVQVLLVIKWFYSQLPMGKFYFLQVLFFFLDMSLLL